MPIFFVPGRPSRLCPSGFLLSFCLLFLFPAGISTTLSLQPRNLVAGISRQGCAATVGGGQTSGSVLCAPFASGLKQTGFPVRSAARTG